jgi:hypothetical protein
MLHQPQPRGGKKEEGSPSQCDLFEIGKLPRARYLAARLTEAIMDQMAR